MKTITRHTSNPARHPALPDPTSRLLAGHRGAPALAPENTLAAFEIAIQLGAKMIEFDVRRTRDGVLVINHDATIRGRRLGDMTYRELIAWEHGRHVPTYEAVLEAAAGRARLDIELKEWGFEAEALELAGRYFRSDEFLVTSEHDLVIKTVKELAPEICAGLVIGEDASKFLLNKLSDFSPVQRVCRTGADFIACNYLLADLGLAKRMARHNIPVMVWTVDSPRRIERYLADPYISGVISNLPAATLGYLHS